jgi:hypothetical protein
LKGPILDDKQIEGWLQKWGILKTSGGVDQLCLQKDGENVCMERMSMMLQDSSGLKKAPQWYTDNYR